MDSSETADEHAGEAPPAKVKKKTVQDDTPTAIVDLPPAPGADAPKPTPPAVRADDKDES
jgi:small conductance mechanosensitive channel